MNLEMLSLIKISSVIKACAFVSLPMLVTNDLFSIQMGRGWILFIQGVIVSAVSLVGLVLKIIVEKSMESEEGLVIRIRGKEWFAIGGKSKKKKG